MPTRGLPENIQPNDPGHIVHHDTLHDLLNPIIDGWLVAGTAEGQIGDRPESPDIDADNAGFTWWSNDISRLDRWSGSEWEEGVGGSNLFKYGGGFTGDLALDTGTLQDDIYSDQTLLKVVYRMGTSPAGQADVFDVIYHPPGGGAASIFAPGNEPTINPGETEYVYFLDPLEDIVNVEAGGYFTYDIIQVGEGGAVTPELIAGTVATYGDGLTNAPTSYPMPMPPDGSYDEGDLLIHVVSMGNTAAALPLTTIPTGWTEKTLADGTTTGHHVTVLWKRASSNAEPGGTVVPAGGVNRPYAAATFAVRGVLDTDAVFDVPRTANTGQNIYTTSSTATPATVAVSTTEDNDVGFVIYSIKYLSGETPGNAVADTPNPGAEIVDIKTARVSQVNTSLHIFYTQDLGAAGALPAYEALLAAGTTWDRGIMFPLALKISGVSGSPGADLTHRLYATG